MNNFRDSYVKELSRLIKECKFSRTYLAYYHMTATKEIFDNALVPETDEKLLPIEDTEKIVECAQLLRDGVDTLDKAIKLLSSAKTTVLKDAEMKKKLFNFLPTQPQD